MTDTLGKQIDKLFKLREQIRNKERDIKELKTLKASAEIEIMASMDDVEIMKASGGLATASISEIVVPTVYDWEQFHKFVHRGKKYYMLERRPSSAAYREELENRRGRAIPGVESYTKRGLNLNIL